MLSARDITGMYAIIPTPALPGADRLLARNTVDLRATETLVENLLRDGVTGLIALGTTGECATLSNADYEAFVTCVLDTVRRRVPTFIGTTALGGHEIARRIAFVRDRGADGTLLGLPMWQPLTVKMAIDYYREVSDSFADVAVMAYANSRAFRFAFPPDFWTAIAKEAPTVTSAKFSRSKGLKELIAATGGKINFIPNEMTVHEFYALSPQTTIACWATAAAMNPLPAVLMMKAIAARNQAAVDLMTKAIGWANGPIAAIVANPDVFASYNIQLEKTRINAAGYCQCGPVRSPYADFPADFVARSQACGRRWARLCAAHVGDFNFKESVWEEPDEFAAPR